MNPEDFAERWAAEQEHRYQAQMEAYAKAAIAQYNS
jgi:hypothetical protein